MQICNILVIITEKSIEQEMEGGKETEAARQVRSPALRRVPLRLSS